jgi:hypothetical protein
MPQCIPDALNPSQQHSRNSRFPLVVTGAEQPGVFRVSDQGVDLDFYL